MNNKEIVNWLNEREIILDESFGTAITNYAKIYKKSSLINMGDIYSLLGVTPKTMSKWRNNPDMIHPKNNIRLNFIERAGKLFSLCHEEKEKLSNKVGLSLRYTSPGNNLLDKHSSEFSNELFPYANVNGNGKQGTGIVFSRHFNLLFSKYQGKQTELYNSASVSERMFHYIKSGNHLKKEPILALLILMGLSLDEIHNSLMMGGLILSKSIPCDAVTTWLLGNANIKDSGVIRLNIINEVLYELGCPLLMTGPGD